jgi:hypothetical protein
MRRILLALCTLAAAWLVFFLPGYGVYLARQVETSLATEGIVTCHYFHATGFYEVTEFTSTPSTVVCSQLFPVHWPAPAPELRRESHWAAPIPGDRPVTVECKFVRRPEDGSGLEQRFSVDSPMRLTFDLSARMVEFIGSDERTVLGTGTPVEARSVSSRVVWLSFQHGALPIFGAGRSTRLTLFINPSQGRANLILNSSSPRLLWVREGGCRPINDGGNHAV